MQQATTEPGLDQIGDQEDVDESNALTGYISGGNNTLSINTTASTMFFGGVGGSSDQASQQERKQKCLERQRKLQQPEELEQKQFMQELQRHYKSTKEDQETSEDEHEWGVGYQVTSRSNRPVFEMMRNSDWRNWNLTEDEMKRIADRIEQERGGTENQTCCIS